MFVIYFSPNYNNYFPPAGGKYGITLKGKRLTIQEALSALSIVSTMILKLWPYCLPANIDFW